jgi:D-alanyl-lipoteichoic acid acyltransferase DltB (MBOAT superfamily)
MLFNSFEFLIFLPIVFLLYWFVFNKNLRNQNLLILIASYVFYGWWSWKFLGLLAFSTVLDFFYGFGVASPKRWRSKLFLWLSIINNVGFLAIFKYYNFFANEFLRAAGAVGLHPHLLLIEVALPVGISFYTFHGMSYVFDIYRGVSKPVTNFVDYAVFVCFFPLLVAGPIERANHLLPQVQTLRRFKYNQAVEGCRLILWGMFKKVVIADALAWYVDEIVNHYAAHSAYTLLIGAIGFSFQVYCDFSGYSDIALGVAKLLGFELLSNFKFPYFSRDIAEFWRRWHISLSSWFRDYLYIPLGGSKEGKLRAVRNVFIVFLVSGFWHGAGWNFVVWGGIHACGFLPLFVFDGNRKHESTIVAENKRFPGIREFFQMAGTFLFVTFAWIFFRIHNIGTAWDYVKRIISGSIEHPSQYLSLPPGKIVLLYIIPVLVADWYFRRDERILRRLGWVISVGMGVWIFLAFRRDSSFIYFRF